jgi:hypothetical protein
VQFPNAPLIVAFVAGEVAAMAHGSVHAEAAAMPACERSPTATAVGQVGSLEDGAPP